jgi:hypothetical protein
MLIDAEETELSLFTDAIIAFVENPGDSLFGKPLL